MTMYVHGTRASQIRRRRRSAAGLALLAVLVVLVGYVLWGPDTATARGAVNGPAATVVPVSAASPPTATAQPPAENTTAQQETATRLDAELARRFAAAQRAAAADGVELTLTSGWRSAAEQQALVDQAVAHDGSVAEAHRWVLPPETSEHVKGLAVDVGPTAGALWLGTHARKLGLCRTYANEMWHFEKLADGATECPDLHLDASWGW
jgi:hypothetical protein